MMPEYNKICVLGLGYVGLPTAAIFASQKIQVIGVDTNKETVETINQGKIHIVEPGLEKIVNKAISSGTLKAKTEIETADAFIIAVPTPLKSQKKPDLKFVEAATRGIAPILKKGDLVVLESTSPVGTTEKICQWLAGERADLSFPHLKGDKADIQVSHSPERVLPGKVLLELVKNDRVVGGISSNCAERTKQLYSLVIEGQCLLTSASTAELVKLTENAYRDVNIAFANELSMVSDKKGVDVWEVIQLANRHPRVDILNPGPGVGGHCIAVDPWFIVDEAQNETQLIQSAREVNSKKPQYVIDQILTATKASGSSAIACLGLTYKADIDDLRGSPAVAITHELSKQFDGEILVVEPHINELPKILRNNVGIRIVNIQNAIKKANVLTVLVDHKQFKELDPSFFKNKIVIDTRGIWH